MKKLISTLGLVTVLLALFFGAVRAEEGFSPAPQQAQNEANWVLEGVHASLQLSDMGGRSLALDAYGNPHIAYGGDHLYYARRVGGQWQIEAVDSAPSMGKHTSLALDAAGHPHISYFDAANGDLRYAHHDGGAWRIEVLDRDGWVGTGNSLDLDAHDRPQISYYDTTNRALKLAWKDSSGWHTATLDNSAGTNTCTSLVTDAGGKPHISYSGDGLKYAYVDADDKWHFELVDGSPSVGGATSLALDSLGRPHISYCQLNQWEFCATLRYAHHDGSTWQTTIVEPPGTHGGKGGYNSLALDYSDRPHISYRDASHGALKYAYHDGSAWQIVVVDSGGYFTSLALDPGGHPRISYYNDGEDLLKYAYVDVPLFADPAFEAVWQRTDKPIAAGLVARSWMWGPLPFSGAMSEPYAESPGGSRLVQYFDKSRMEINDPNGDPSSPWFVTNGLLVREMVDGWIQVGDSAYESRSPAQEAVAGDPVAVNPSCPVYATFTSLTWERAENRLGEKVTAALARDGTVREDPSKAGYAGTEIAYYEDVTGHNVPQVLWDFMNQRGLIYLNGRYQTGLVVDWLYAMGYPISEPYWVRCTVAGEEKDVLVQLFERRVLTYTPSNPAGWRVEMGNVGLHYYAWRYSATPAP